jgi:hypothetical protein
VSFQQEQTLVRIRRRASSLWISYGVMALASGILTWASLRPLETWIAYSIYAACAIALLIFWLIPAWSFATNYTDVTTARIIVHAGMFARVKRDIQLSAVTGIEYVRGKGVSISVGEGEPVLLASVSRPKALAEQLRESLAK